MLVQQIFKLQKQLKELEMKSQLTAGQYIINLYNSGGIKDEEIKQAIAKIVGDDINVNLDTIEE